jgi:SAM-dependent methyltransferase
VLGYAARMSDSLRPTVEQTLADWAVRVQADHAQVDRARELADPPDFYAPVAHRFHLDPRRTDDSTLDVLLRHAKPAETWLDVGAGAGRFALPLALLVEEVVAVEPSRAMVEGLDAGMREHGVSNIRVIADHWPMIDPPTADVSLMAHVGYDIAEIGPFLDALEAATRRLCVAVMGESAMTTVASLFWQQVHGEPRVRLPALPELLVLLLARGRLPEVTLVERAPPTFESVDEALAMAHRQLWIAEGSPKDELLQNLVAKALVEHDGRYSFDPVASRIGIVNWAPSPSD